MVWYFYHSQNKLQKKKGKIKQRKKGKGLPLAQAKPAHPSPAGPKWARGSSSTPRCQAAPWQGADAVDATSTPSTFQAAPCHLIMSWRTAVKPCFISPSSLVLSLPLLVFPFSSESSRRSPSTTSVANAGEEP